MAEQAVRPSVAETEPARNLRWRTVDIVVTAVLGVAFGVAFWAWNLLWVATGAAFTAFPPAQAVLYGVWLIPAVVAPLIVRKPGAGLLAELMAAVVSALLGSSWGAIVLLYGLLQGVAGELGYAAFGYRRFGWPQAFVSAALAGVMAAGVGPPFYYPPPARRWENSQLPLVAPRTTG